MYALSHTPQSRTVRMHGAPGGTPGREGEGTLNGRRACAAPRRLCPVLRSDVPAFNDSAKVLAPRRGGAPTGAPFWRVLAAALFVTALVATAAQPQTAAACCASGGRAESRGALLAEPTHGCRPPSQVARMVGESLAATAGWSGFGDHGVERHDAPPPPVAHQFGRTLSVFSTVPLVATGSRGVASSMLSEEGTGRPGRRAAGQRSSRAPPQDDPPPT